MNIIDSLQWRYATKSFNPNSYISTEKIETITKAFNLTATSYGLQPIKLVVISNKTLQADLVQHSMNQKQVAQASHVLVFCTVNTIDDTYIETYFKRVKTLRDTPDDILNPFKNYLINDFENKTKEEILNWSIKQAYLAMGNLLTVCAVEEIDACPMEGFSPKEYDAFLNLKDHGLSSVLVMPIGYRAEDDMFAGLNKVRKDIKESVINL